MSRNVAVVSSVPHKKTVNKNLYWKLYKLRNQPKPQWSKANG